MKDDANIIYSLSVADIQTVAEAEYGRQLSEEELEAVEENLGDYVNWYDLIDITISNHVKGIAHKTS